VEIDTRLVAVLATVVPDTVRIVAGDALALDWDDVLGDAPGWTLVANLPYNVATPLVIGLLERVPQIARLLVMVQLEVAERLAATPGGKAYGAVTVRIAYFATARLVGQVSPEVFYPRPNVASALVELVRRPTPAVDPAVVGYAELDVLVRAGFAGRRKMLRRALAGLVTPEVFAAAGLAGTERAEELDVETWGKLAACKRSIASGRSPS
jgi:16S rRNA (adenine1518-N6/adenine1519-N6)-dimethyltransferase